MWVYEKKLQYPVRIKRPDAKAAQVIMSQLGGPDGELAASMRYLHQRFTMPSAEAKGLLTDIGTSVTAMPFQKMPYQFRTYKMIVKRDWHKLELWRKYHLFSLFITAF